MNASKDYIKIIKLIFQHIRKESNILQNAKYIEKTSTLNFFQYIGIYNL